MHRWMIRVLFIVLWFLSIAALAGWLVAAVHRQHLAAMLIVGVGLAGLVIVPLLASRLNQRQP